METKLFGNFGKVKYPLDLSKFQLLANYSNISRVRAYETGNILLLRLNTNTKFPTKRGMDTNVFTKVVFGLLEMQSNQEELLITAKSRLDKVINIFSSKKSIPNNVAPQFYSKFNFHQTTKRQALNLNNTYGIANIKGLEELELEANNGYLLFCISRLPYSKNIIEETIRIGNELRSIFDTVVTHTHKT